MDAPDYIEINGFKHISYHIDTYSKEKLISKSESFYKWLDERRSVRDYSDKWVPK